MKNKFKIILIGLASLFFALTFPVKINAATTSYRPSTAEVTDTQDVYTLPPQPACESPKGAGQDRQPLGYILQPGGSITITNNSDIGFTVQLSNDNSAATINERVPAHSTVTIMAPNPPLPQTNKAGKVIKADANDVDLVPFILTPRTNKTTDKISCNVTVQGPHAKLPIFSYTNDNQTTFMDEWKQSGSYALIQGKGFQIMLPTDAQSYVENMDKAPEGMDAEGQPKPVPEGQKYVCYNLMDVLHFYDDVLYPTYDKIAGLSTDAKEPYNKLVPGKYFYTSDIKFAGGANYSSARTEDGGVDDALCWLQPNWVLFHETGHGYQTRELGGKEADQHVMEVSNNILGNYMYYILFNGDSKGADQYSWNYMSAKGVNKEQMETDVHNILVDNNWSWDQILPHNGGRGKHLGLILLQNMVEKMTYAGWTEVYQMDRQQVYEANQKKETDLNDKLMNIWNLITKAAADHGYDYTAIMDEIGKTPQLPLSQEARQKQDKAVNFLWYLMPKASYNQVYAVVQELAKADPSLIYDSNFTLVTPDETKALNLNGKLNLTIYDMPSSWAGKTINIMDGNQVYGTLTIGPDGKCSLNNVPLGTYTLAGLPDSSHTLTNYYVTVTDDPAYMNSTDVIPHSESSSTSSTTSSSKQSSTASSSLKSSSKSSSEVSSKKGSMIKSTSKASSKSVSSEESSSIKSSVKSSSEVSSKKSSMIKSTSKASSKKASSKESSSIKSSAKSSSEVSSKKSSMIKSSSKTSSMKTSSKESSVESSSKEVASSSSVKSTTAKSHRGEARPVESSSSIESSSNINTESSSTINTVSSSSANKPSKNTETSVKVPSKASTISYVDKSTEKSVPVTVSSETNTMVESSISSAVRTGSGSSSFGSSMINKPTLVSSSMNVPATSWSKEIVNGSSATTVGTTVITYSQSEIPNKESKSESIISKPTANTATTQHTTVINNNNHSPKQGRVAVAGNNNSNGQSGQAAQSNKSGKGNGHGEGLPQTGEAAATAAVGLGIVLIAISGIVVLEKKK
ncbi:M60 family metallopeptidase [Ligilactobacillus aviarius]|uniref:M60 family metallopeptidase n=1 Tax=Ligilactobacillus aviarius TaxID=1606 RepID=UPI0024B94B2F|nr:M60 family metallopeptidase [Ligilactobacillus aviarius]